MVWIGIGREPETARQAGHSPTLACTFSDRNVRSLRPNRNSLCEKLTTGELFNDLDAG
jgi:hypothetical protein